MMATILFADDNDALRQALAFILEEQRHEVIQVRTPMEALAVFESGAAIDLVISDVSLPSSADAGTLAQLRLHAAPLPLIYISGFPLAEAASRYAMRPGAPFLTKPFSATALFAAVREALEGPPGPDAA